jgi:hypothetical protein
MLRGMTRQTTILATLLSLVLAAVLGATAAAQVATLATPGPDAEASDAPTEQLDGEEAILEFVACLRENGIDVPDPQFGAGGTRFGADPEVLARIDFMSSEFLDAMESCQHLLEALQPEIDPEEQAEQNEQLLVFAQCMRGEGIDFPDPDPIRGFTVGAMRGEDGELAIDFFSSDFQAASTACSEEVGLQTPGL